MAGPHKKSKTLPLDGSHGWNDAGLSRNQTISEGTFVGSDKLQHAQQNFPPLHPHQLASSNPLTSSGPSGVGDFDGQSSSPAPSTAAPSPSDNPSAQFFSAPLPSEADKTTTPATTTPLNSPTTLKGKLAVVVAQVKSTPWRRWCLLAMVLALAISIPVGWQLRIRDFTIQGDSAPAALLLAPTLVAVDPDKQTITMDWKVDYNNCDQDRTLCSDINIYFDQNLLRGDTPNSAPASNNLPTPIFQINGSLWGTSILSNTPFFRTEIALFNGFGGKSGKSLSLQSYPFDRYGADVFMYAQDANASFYTIALEEATGVAPGFTAKITFGGNTTDTLISMDLDISRGLVVRIYVITIITSIWLVTLTLLSMTVAVVILGRKMASEILIVPVTTLFAFTQLRGTFPGAPTGFGATVDFVGILPCLALLTLCAVFLLAVFLFRDPEKQSAPIFQLCMWRPRRSKISDISPAP